MQSLLSHEQLSTIHTKDDLVLLVQNALAAHHLAISEIKSDKPWGIEFKINENDAPAFLAIFFETTELPSAVLERPFGPKILAIEPSKRLSWHVHERKDAFLRNLQGTLHVYMNPTDEETTPTIAEAGAFVHVPELMRHRLGAVDGWTIVAEISRNVFPNHPSNDADERRISDDFGRT